MAPSHDSEERRAMRPVEEIPYIPVSVGDLDEITFLREASSRATQEARRDLLAQGIGLVTGEGKRVVRQNSDGSVEILPVTRKRNRRVQERQNLE